MGPQGLPRGYAVVLGMLGLLVAAQGALRRATTGAPADASGPAIGADLRAMGLLVFGAAYLVLIGTLGYIVTVALLLFGVALYVGARLNASLVAFGIGGAALLWATFAQLFQLGLPVGSLWQRLIT